MDCTALLNLTIPLAARITSTILNSIMTAKQKIPKLCMGRRVCQIVLSGSSEIQTLISVNMKIISNTMSMMVDANTYNQRQNIQF